MARASESEWAKRVERWKDSGLTAKEFASETGLNASTLAYWKWRLTSESEAARVRSAGDSTTRTSTSRRSRSKRHGSARTGADTGAPAFVELSVAAEAPPAPGVLEVVLATGTLLRVPVGTQEQTLRSVLRALGAVR